MTDLIATLIERYHYSQPISLINYFGVLLAQKILLAKKASGNSLVSKCSYIEQGMIPFPIYSAIIGNAGNCEYSWIEFTPYEIGSTKLGSFIPTWAFDRPFNNGVSQNFAAPQTLSYGMGIWGSAISITAAEFFKNITLPRLIEEGEHTKRIAEDEVCCSQTRTSYDYRFSPARVANWNFGSTQLPLSDQKTITLVDAGIQCSLPLAPLLRPERAIDIILVFDASSDELGSELQIAQTWAHEQGLKFPPINYDLIHNTCSVHQHPTDPSVPTIIYMPLMKNRHYKNGWDPRTADFTSTFNFVYSCAQVAQLSGLSACNILTNQAMILDTIHEWIIRKKQRTL
jgi:phospholipase A2